MSNYGPYEGPTMKDFDEDAKSNKPKATDFVKVFSGAITEGLKSRTKNTDAARSASTSTDQKFTGFGGSSSSSGMNKDLTVVHSPGASFSPFTIAGTPGKKGFGGAIGRVAGAALGIALAPVTGGGSLALAGLGSQLGGAIGDSYEENRYG